MTPRFRIPKIDGSTKHNPRCARSTKFVTQGVKTSMTNPPPSSLPSSCQLLHPESHSICQKNLKPQQLFISPAQMNFPRLQRPPYNPFPSSAFLALEASYRFRSIFLPSIYDLVLFALVNGCCAVCGRHCDDRGGGGS